MPSRNSIEYACDKLDTLTEIPVPYDWDAHITAREYTPIFFPGNKENRYA